MMPMPDSNRGNGAPPADKPAAPAGDQPVEPVADETVPATEGGITPAVTPEDKGASHGISVDPDAFLIKG